MMQAKTNIREIIENWAVWRDSGDFANLATCWHEDGRMVATWFTGSVAQFIAGCRASFEKGAIVQHMLGGSSITLNGTRAIAQTKMMILSRSTMEGVACDTTCVGRFYDFFEERAGRWAIVLRQPVYEKDRFDPLDPNEQPKLDATLLATFPVGYRYMGYAQTKEGRTVNRGLPGLHGPEIKQLYADGASWLAGHPLTR
jgi:hypothetical protein